MNKDYNQSILERLADGGVKAFHINGARFKYHEYKPLVNDLKDVFAKSNEIPSILFDLKGSAPYVTRLEEGKKQIKVKTGQTVKITFDNSKIKENGIIFIDKKISHLLKEGDTIYISSSDAILKVIGKERFPSQSLFKRNRSYRQLKNKDNFREELRTIYDLDEGSWADIQLTKIKEEISDFSIDQDEQLLFEAYSFDSNFDEKIINKQLSMNKTYKNIIKKHDFKNNENTNHFSFTTTSKY
jgi:hypothetical protein